MNKDKRAAPAQLAVSGKQCDTKKQRAMNQFSQRERARKGTDKILQVCSHNSLSCGGLGGS
jgi:hypothetical protein